MPLKASKASHASSSGMIETRVRWSTSTTTHVENRHLQTVGKDVVEQAGAMKHALAPGVNNTCYHQGRPAILQDREATPQSICNHHVQLAEAS